MNSDGTVDGVDSELLNQVIVSNADYDSIYDFNRDGVVNASDMQILGSNYGFAANRAPIVTAPEVLTHTDLEAFIELDTIATDPEGDEIYFRLANPEQGSISFTPDNKFVRFTPNAGYSGDASFELIADDGYSSATPVTVDINVSDAPLVNLDIVNRSPRLDAGESTPLVVIGDFADQEDVILPASYLQFAAENELVARVTDTGVLVGEGDGVSIVSVQKSGIEAVTALRVGNLLPTNEAEDNILLVENNGLNVYPGAVVLTEDATRQILVGIKAIYESPELNNSSTGTRYFVNNPDIVDVSEDGLITALNNGVANITVIHGASEYILPVQLEFPTVVSTSNGTAVEAQLDDEGGIIEIQVTDGSNEELSTQLMVAPGTLFDETDIRFTPLLEENQVSLATPEDFLFISGFKLEAGDNPLAFPLQLAMELPSEYKNDPSVIGQTVYFFEKGYVPDATGEIEEKWLVAETGIVDADGMIRTQSPPWKGVREGEYMTSFDRAFGSGRLVKGKVVATFNMPEPFVSLFPFSYTQTNNFNTISIGNFDSDIKITNNNTDAYISDGKLTTRVLDSSLEAEYQNIKLEISGIGKDIFDLGNKILGLNKEETSLLEDIKKLKRIYDAIKGDEDDDKAKKKGYLDRITRKEKQLSEVKGLLQTNRDNKEALELRKTKLSKRTNVLLDTFNSFTSLPGINLLGMLETAPFLTLSYDISSLEVTQVPAIGLPTVTQTGVQLDADGLPTFEVKLDVPEVQESGPAAPPVLQQAQLRFQDENNQSYENNEPILFLTGSNVLVENGNDNLGRNFEDLIVKFQMGSTIVEAEVLTELSERLPDNEFKVAVKIPDDIVLGMTDISIIRRQNKVIRRIGPKEFKKEVKFESNEIELEPTGEYILGVQRLSDFVSVIDGRDPNTLANNQEILSSADLLLARIPIGEEDVRDFPRDIAITSDGSRAYSTLQNTGRIALIDTMVLQQVDINPETKDDVDFIDLGQDASPRGIVIDSRDQYAYISDSRIGLIYVVDVDANSGEYHQVVEKIQVEPAPKGLREMAISSDGRRLFIAAPSTRTARGLDINEKSQIIVINIDPKDRPLNESRNEKKWHKQIAQVEAGRRVEGMSTTPDPKKIVFTNRQDDDNGYGILEIIEDEPDNFVADTRYASLRLGPKDDYFDLNNGVSVTVTRDGQYGFVVGNNSGPFLALGSKTEDVDGVQAGSNVGIIEDPLGENPQLIGATRPLPVAFSNDLVLSPDDKYLYVANPNGVGVTTYDVDEIIYTLDNPGDFTIDLLDRSEGSKFYDENTQRQAKFLDFFTVSIDDINPLVSVTADYGIIAEDRPRGQFTYGVLEVPDGNGGFVESSNGPIGTFVHNLAATPGDLIELIGPDGKGNDSTPTFEWDFLVPDDQITEVNLFVSTFAEGEGLLPWDELADLSDSSFLPQFTEDKKRELLTERWNGYDDFNPGRILTATWKKETNTWYDWNGDEIIASEDDPINTSTRLTLAGTNAIAANAASPINWAAQATTSTGDTQTQTGQFRVAPQRTTTPFSSVTILTHGFTPPIVSAFDVDQHGVPRDYYRIADNITKAFGEEPDEKGLTMRYNHATGYWVPVDENGGIIAQLTGGLDVTHQNYWSTLITNLKNGIEINGELVNYFDENNPVNKPLVLLPTWNLRDENSAVGNESAIPDSGFTEAAADALFASLVMFDQELAGEVGREEDGQIIIYDQQGKLIREQGGIFDSPLHFIGFSRGTVVNSEIIQRLGTYFPDAGGVQRDGGGNIIPDTGDLQMTTLDPHDFDQPSLNIYRDFYEPKVQVWDNVTFADNYYQTVANPNGLTLTPNGRDIPGLPESETNKNPRPAGLRFPEGGGTDYTALLNNRTGFENDNRIGGPHSQVMAWYAGTVNLLLEEMKLYGGITREPDVSQNISTPIYDQLGEEDIQEYISNSSEPTPWYSNEGVNEGWYYSVLAGGEDERPQSGTARIPVTFDNTLEERMRGDFAVPTLFNGNFDAVFQPKNVVRNAMSSTIPGWSFHGGSGRKSDGKALNTNALFDWKDIPSLNEKRITARIRRNTDKQRIDPNGNLVDELDVRLLKNSLLTQGYQQDNNGNLLQPDGSIVRGFGVNQQFIEDLKQVGYTISPVQGRLIYPNGQTVVGIDINRLATDLSTLNLGYNLIGNNLYRNNNQSNNIILNGDIVEDLRNEVAGIKESYLERLGINGGISDYQSNYALHLKPGDSITHNRFIVPDWGVLRFDLHVPNPEPVTNSKGEILPQNSVVRVFLDDQELQSSAFQGLIPAVRQRNGNLNISNDEYPAVDLRKFNPAIQGGINPKFAEGQSNRIGFAEKGFQTFQVDIPNIFRGKAATLRFEVNANNSREKRTVYLDNVFFKSQHLLFGNPQMRIDAENKQEARKDIDTPLFTTNYGPNEINPDSNFSRNYLIEKPQYSLSYYSVNGDFQQYERQVNWVSYQLNKSWLGGIGRIQETFLEDPKLPFNNKVEHDDFGTKVTSYTRGHMATAEHRNRNSQDYYSTFLTNNIIPQPLNVNKRWGKLETFLTDLVKNENKEIYIVAGGDGLAPVKRLGEVTKDKNNQDVIKDENRKVVVPNSVWKVVLILDKPGQGIANVTRDALAFALYLPNTLDYTEKGQEDKIQNTDKPWQDNFVFNGKGFGLYNIRKLEEETGYNFLSSLPVEIQDIIEKRNVGDIKQRLNTIKPASLMAAEDKEFLSSVITTIPPLRTANETSTRHSGVPNQIHASTNQAIIDMRAREVSFDENSIIESSHSNFPEMTKYGINLVQITTPQIGFIERTSPYISGEQISIADPGLFQITFTQKNATQVSSGQIGSNQIDITQISPSQVNISQNHTIKVKFPTIFRAAKSIESVMSQFDTSKVTFPISIPLQQLLSSNLPDHYLSSLLTNTFKDNPLNLTLEITDLPTGQLAEAQVTHYTDQGIPNGGKILIDHNANGLGWFIDPTPLDHSEFSQTLADTDLLATADSEAHGKYDLLTTILHELGHLAGFISGYNEFDRHIQTINGKKTFVADNFTATLSSDGSHLDPTVHPHDLMNTTLKPGVRKLPSLLNLQILNALRSEGVREGESEGLLTAPLTSAPLIGINNGTFDTQDIWSTRGAANIIEGQAVLTEESRLNSSFTQDFIIPDEAKYLQFTILDADLDDSNLAPGDAFEVALLNTNTFTPLAGITDEFTQTDALLNIQHDGDTYFSDKVKLSGAPTSGSSINLNSPRTVTVDIRDIAPNTEATLYFDLLGFGSKQSKVVIDNVRILTDDVIIPVANNNTATTNQGQPVIIDILDNDSDADGTINPSTVQIETAPTNGNITINDDNTITYTPNSNQPGEDSFTYTVQDDEGNTSNTATVNITINNTAPSINEITVEPNIGEGIAATFSATATDLDELTYTWDFGDNTEPVTGQNVSHTFADNGTYTATLTVTDSNGAPTVETITLTVNNIAPTVNAGDDQTAVENQEITFNGNYTDPGILDTHTIEWDLGDGTVVENELNPTHTYTTPGSYIATLTVTDSDGGTDSDTIAVTVVDDAPLEITKLKFEQQLLKLRVYENSQLVENVQGEQNQEIDPLAFERIQIIALNSNELPNVLDDRTSVDNGEGIGITDGDDYNNSARKKHISGDEVLQIKIQPIDKYDSAKTAFVTVDRIKSIKDKTIGGQVKIIALNGTTVVGVQTYDLNNTREKLTFANDKVFDRLHLVSGDGDTQFTFRIAEFDAIKTNDIPTYLKFSQNLLTLKVEENGTVVETIQGNQNQPVADAFERIEITAIDSQDTDNPTTDRTFHDNGEGIGILDGEDGNTISKQKRIDGDEILQLGIQPTENYNSALSAIVKLDQIKSNDNNGGKVQIVALRNGVIVGGKTYTIGSRTKELFFLGNQAFDKLHISAADSDTKFTFRSTEFETTLSTPEATASLKLIQSRQQIKVYENNVLVNEAKATQNNLASAFDNIQVTAIDSTDSRLIVDQLQIDQGEGIGIKDGDDWNSSKKKRIDGDEALQLKIKPNTIYSSANQAIVGLDRIQSNGVDGGVVKVIAMMGDTIVSEELFAIDSRSKKITFNSNTPFDAVRLMAGDSSTRFTFKYLDFQVLVD